MPILVLLRYIFSNFRLFTHFKANGLKKGKRSKREINFIKRAEKTPYKTVKIFKQNDSKRAEKYCAV